MQEITLSDELQSECEVALNHMRQGNSTAAAILFETILRKQPKLSFAWNNRGLCLLNLGHPFDGIMNIDKAIEQEPNEPSFYNNKGACFYDMGDVDNALTCYDKAVELHPEFPETWNNIGNAKKFKGDLKNSIAAYRRSIAAKPDYVDAHLHLSFALLTDGQYEEGWKEFEWRWKSPQLPPRGLKIPQWNGESLEGKRLLIYAEQGHGDALQFVRYATLVKEKFGGFIAVEIRQPLQRLFKTVKGVDAVYILGERLGEFDYAVPMMSLPRIMGTTVDTIPWSGPYFHIDPYGIEHWARNDLALLPHGPLKVGLCWAGMSREGRPEAKAVDAKRSTALSSFYPAAQVPGVVWVSLQKGPPSEQIKSPPTNMVIGEFTENLHDFYDTACMIENLDLVISVDTAVVHLAAALGKPTWMIGRYDGCWRWLKDRKDTPWYPTMRVFTQPSPNDWDSVMKEVASALKQWVAEKTYAKS